MIRDKIQSKLNNFEGTKDYVVRMLSGESVDVDVDMYLNTMTDFKNKNDVFTYLLHLGYLAYNRLEKTCYIPNKEVQLEWLRAVSTLDDYAVTNKIVQA